MKNHPLGLTYNFQDEILRDPATVGTAIFGAFGSTGAAIGAANIGLGLTVSKAVGYLAVSTVSSWAMLALSPKSKEFDDFTSGGLTSKSFLFTSTDPIAPQDFVYGTIRKGGTFTYYESTGPDGKYFHKIIPLAGHEVDAITDIYLDDKVVSIDGNGYVTSSPWNSKIRIKKHLGAPGQTVDPDLLAESSQIDSRFKGEGIAYIYVRYESDQNVFADGEPMITAVVRGKKVYDPRSGLTAYSNNSALCTRDWLVSSYGLKADQVDDIACAAAANICDEDVALAAGGTEKRYTMNGVIRANEKPGAVLKKMMTTCVGTTFFGGGYYKQIVGHYSAPVKTFTLDDLRSSISLSTRVNARDQFNGVKGVFPDASNRWITDDYTAITSETFRYEDGGEEQMLDLPQPYTTSAPTAQRIAAVTLYRGREQMRITADFGLSAIDVECGDIVAITNPRTGWVEKEFEVANWSLGKSSESEIRVPLVLQEISESAFDPDATETEIIYNNTTLPNAFATANVGLSLTPELRVENQTVVGALVIDVTSDSPFVNRFEVQFKRSSSADWVMAGQASGSRFEIVGISDGYFDVRARSINAIGIKGEFNTVTNFYASLFEALPDDVTNFSANVVGSTLHLSWEPVGNLDLSHYKIRYSPEISGTTYQRAVDIVDRVSRPGNAAIVPSQSGTYFIKAVDKLGKLSENPASIVIDTNVADIENLNVVETQQEHPSFSGSKNNVVATTDESGTYLTLTGSTLFDDMPGNFDDALGFFDGGGGSVQSSGTYDFAGYIDLGQVYVSRVTSVLEVDFKDYVNDFDSASGLFDDREGLFDGDPNAFDTTSVKTQISTTNDDPASSPTWSDYRDFIVSDVAARAMRFRAVLETSNAANAPAVRELTVKVDMPDRDETGSDITYTGSKVVTFQCAFNATPAIGIGATLADGDRYAITSKNREGFTITTYTGSTVSSNQTQFDFVARGYGKELTT